MYGISILHGIYAYYEEDEDQSNSKRVLRRRGWSANEFSDNFNEMVQIKMCRPTSCGLKIVDM